MDDAAAVDVPRGAPEPHPDLGALTAFLGQWRGRGAGHYPTIDDFTYLEQVAFEHVGKPFLSYVQGTRRADEDHPDHGRPLHAESGYVRPIEGGRAEWVIAQPTGIVEVLEGTLEATTGGAVLDVVATTVGASGSAKRVTATRRHYEVDGDVLAYDVWMAYASLPVTHHLHGELRRA